MIMHKTTKRMQITEVRGRGTLVLYGPVKFGENGLAYGHIFNKKERLPRESYSVKISNPKVLEVFDNLLKTLYKNGIQLGTELEIIIRPFEFAKHKSTR